MYSLATSPLTDLWRWPVGTLYTPLSLAAGTETHCLLPAWSIFKRTDSCPTLPQLHHLQQHDQEMFLQCCVDDLKTLYVPHDIHSLWQQYIPMLVEGKPFQTPASAGCGVEGQTVSDPEAISCWLWDNKPISWLSGDAQQGEQANELLLEDSWEWENQSTTHQSHVEVRGCKLQPHPLQ